VCDELAHDGERALVETRVNTMTAREIPLLKRLLGMGVLILVGMTALLWYGTERSASAATKDQFVGAWRLVSLEEPGADGELHQADCTGLLVFTRDGHMSVQVMYKNPQPGAQAGPVQYAQGGYEASFGTYDIKDAHAFTYHVDGALVRTLIGQSLNRVYEFSGNRLIVKSSNPKEHWRVVWQRD